MIVSALSLALSPASLYLAAAYKVPVIEVNMCGVIFTATFVPMTFAAMWMYKVMPTHRVLQISCVMQLVGGWCRMWADVENHKFWPVLVGQIIISLAQPVVYNVMTQLCNTWFPDEERSLLIAICGLSIPGGNLMAYLMSGLIFKAIEDATPQGVEDQLMTMLWVQNVWITLVMVPYMVLIREKPEKPPSLVATKEKEDVHFFQDLKEALRVKEYNKMSLAFALLQGGFLAFGTNMSELFTPVGF